MNPRTLPSDIVAANEQTAVDNLDLAREAAPREETRSRSLKTDIEAIEAVEVEDDEREDSVSNGDGNDGITFAQLKAAAAAEAVSYRRRRRDVEAVEVESEAAEGTGRNAEIIPEDTLFPDVQGVSKIMLIFKST